MHRVCIMFTHRRPAGRPTRPAGARTAALARRRTELSEAWRGAPARTDQLCTSNAPGDTSFDLPLVHVTAYRCIVVHRIIPRSRGTGFCIDVDQLYRDNESLYRQKKILSATV